jgi:hypothetical protein
MHAGGRTMGRNRVAVGLGWCAICLALGSCRRLEDGGLGGAAPSVRPAGPDEPARPRGSGSANQPDAAAEPESSDSSVRASGDGGAQQREAPGATSTGADVALPADAAVASPPPPPPDAGSGDDLAPASPDGPLVPPVLAVTHDRPACLATITCGTQANAESRLSYDYAVTGPGTNRYLVAAVALGAAGRNVEVTFGGTTLTAIGSAANAAGTCQVGLFGLTGPLPGARPLVVTISGPPIGIVLSVASFTNVDPVTPYRPGGYRPGTGTGPELLVGAPSGPGEVTVDAACVTGDRGLNVFAPSAPSVEVFDALIGPGKEAVQSVRPALPAPLTSVRYHVGGAGLDWAAGIVALRPAGAGPGGID